MVDRIPEWGALGIVLIALLVVARMALNGNEAAIGALIGVVSAGVGYFLRGKIETK